MRTVPSGSFLTKGSLKGKILLERQRRVVKQKLYYPQREEKQMKRPCEYSGCTATLSEFVPLQIKLCGQHQRQRRLLKERLDSEKLPEEDIQFIFYHPRGCNANQLALRLGISLSTLSGYLKRGVIRDEKRENPSVWQIPAEEIERAIILTRNWITVWKASRDTGVEKATLLTYVRKGYFGPHQVHLCGGLAIRKEELPGLLEKYEKIKREVWLNQRHWLGKCLRKDEITPRQISKLLQMTINGIYWWRQKGWLPSERRKGRVVINKSDFVEFAQRAINEEYPLRPRTKEALEKFILTQNPP